MTVILNTAINVDVNKEHMTTAKALLKHEVVNPYYNGYVKAIKTFDDCAKIY